jgi:DNA-binding CsgD family transcriptional regulator
MKFNAQRLAIADHFYAAALGRRSWRDGLSLIADVAGAHAAQLIRLDGRAGRSLNLYTGLDPAIESVYFAEERDSPSVNLRVRAGTETPLMRTVVEGDYVAADDWSRDRHFQEFARPWDIPHSCIVPVFDAHGCRTVLAVFRSARAGPIERQARGRFATVARLVHDSLAMQHTVAHEGERIASGTLEAASMAAFFCNQAGVVLRTTAAAEALLRDGEFVRVNRGVLEFADGKRHRLADAIASATTAAGVPRPRRLTAHSRVSNARTRTVEVLALPELGVDFQSFSRALVVIKTPVTPNTGLADSLQAEFQLTSAEAEIALKLNQGATPAQIAQARGVSVATVRSQIKRIYSKLDVHRQAELVARLRGLG